MFVIANTDAALFQRGSGRAARARLRLLRQHTWALFIRRRSVARSRDCGSRAVATRARELPGEDLDPGFLDQGCASALAGPVSSSRSEPASLSTSLFY